MEERTLLLERLHVALVASIERANSHYLREPFRIAEIYEDLIPYRTHRDLIGVAMNGDYEDGLMRILAGQGDYLIVESPEVRQALVDELEKKHPDTGLFKQYADEAVRLNPNALGMSPPSRPVQSVAKLFQPTAGHASGGGAGRWGLGDARSGEGESKRGTKDATSGQQPVSRMQTKVGPSGAESGAENPAVDQVGTSQKFWLEAEPAKSEAEAPGGEDRTGRLEAENRRLKILLAEHVLEVEELRERLGGEGAGAHERKR